ncbi:MAG TPA: glutathione peroxidase [Phycisphaerales bacterium]|nr:glutathione peroxidase [Phycisphaerales bacterium]
MKCPCCSCVCGLVLSGAVLVAAGPGDQRGCCQPEGEKPAACCQKESLTSGAAATETDNYVLDHRINLIDGTPADLSQYKGKVILIVNTASKCGHTPQYDGLEKLYQEKKGAGLVVLGFPANDFKGQEPGTNKEIGEFCRTKYGVSFPMFQKIAVTGARQHPLYAQLTGQAAPIGGEVQWNFTKFLVDREGRVVARFEPKVKPNDPELRARVEELLRQPAPPEKAPSAGA